MLCLTIIFLLVLLIFYIFCKLTCGMCRSAACLVGKTAIVTGGNSGIGYEVCLNLASRGCKVVIADKDDSEKSRKTIIQQTNNPNIISKHLNLASFESVRKFANDINSEIDKLDILVNNAGVPTSFDITEDHLDLTMQVNYFGPFLLTHLLLEKLKKSENGRIVFTSSIWVFLAYINVKTFGQLNESHDIRGYATSKLATIMAADILADQLKNANITVNSVHPGLVHTQIYTKIPVSLINGPVRILMMVLSAILGKDAYEGSQSTLHAVLTQETTDKVTGKFFLDCLSFIKPFQVYDKNVCRKVWEISEKRVQLTQEERLQFNAYNE